MRAYVCNRYPELNLGFVNDRELKFSRGVLECYTDEEIARVENHQFFNVFIVPRDLPEQTDGKGGEQSPPSSSEGSIEEERLSLSKIGVMRKEELFAICNQYGIEVPQNATRTDLIQRITAYLKSSGSEKP